MSNELTTTNPKANLPAFAVDVEKDGIDQAAQDQATPRLKIVESMTSKEVKQIVSEGGVIVTPTNEAVAQSEEPFLVTPIFSWTSFQMRSDHDDPNSPFIEEETLARTSDIARRAGSAQARTETYGDNGKYQRNYCQVLNFIFWLHDLQTPAAYSYAMGSFQNGKVLNTMLVRRNVHVCLNKIEMATQVKSNGKNEWYVFVPQDPHDGELFIQDEALFNHLLEQREMFKGALEAGAIQVSPEEQVSEEA